MSSAFRLSGNWSPIRGPSLSLGLGLGAGQDETRPKTGGTADAKPRSGTGPLERPRGSSLLLHEFAYISESENDIQFPNRSLAGWALKKDFQKHEIEK